MKTQLIPGCYVDTDRFGKTVCVDSCDVFWNSSGVVSNFDEVTLQLDESEE